MDSPRTLPFEDQTALTWLEAKNALIPGSYPRYETETAFIELANTLQLKKYPTQVSKYPVAAIPLERLGEVFTEAVMTHYLETMALEQLGHWEIYTGTVEHLEGKLEAARANMNKAAVRYSELKKMDPETMVSDKISELWSSGWGAAQLDKLTVGPPVSGAWEHVDKKSALGG